jgi:transcriptional regulator with XRE-family HTH domain
MTPQEFKAWRKSMGFTQVQAAAALDMSRVMIGLYECGHRRDGTRPAVTIPRVVELACAYLSMPTVAAAAEKRVKAERQLYVAMGEASSCP